MKVQIFERREIKYLLSPSQLRQLRPQLYGRLTPDCHGRSTVCNLYCDTPQWRLVRRSLEKPTYKEKLRLRSYGPAQPGQPVFLELKKKYRGVVYKRRIALPQDLAMACLQDWRALPQDSQIGREIAYFLQFYQPLSPRVYLCYDREAYFSAADPTLRLTLDQNIRFRTGQLSLCAAPSGTTLLPEGQALLEIKAGTALPLWLSRMLCHLAIRPTSFSKYGRAYESLGRPIGGETPAEGGEACA